MVVRGNICSYFFNKFLLIFEKQKKYNTRLNELKWNKNVKIIDNLKKIINTTHIIFLLEYYHYYRV